MESKICIKCNINKLVSEFGFRKDTNKYKNTCKCCSNKYSRELDKEEKNKNKREKYNAIEKDKKRKYYESIKSTEIFKQKRKQQSENWLSNPDNKEKLKEYQKNWKKNKKLTDPFFRLKKNMRNLIRDSFLQKGLKKNSKTENILGCTFDELRIYIESKWDLWMNWNNKGNWNGYPKEINVSWDIDHIIPLDAANTEEEIIKLNHYTNLQPLCSYTNRHIKRNHVI